MGRVIGIDLGTCNSCMAILKNGSICTIPNAEGKNTTPSAVFFEKDGSIQVGEKAKEKSALFPDRTVLFIKSKMGTDDRIHIDQKTYTPQEISGIILRKMKRDAEKFLGEAVTGAVITVPAYFNDAQRQATRDAGIIAGLDVKRIINEPTAASLAYGLDKNEEERIAVYDLGGGTFDISILEISDGVFEVLSSNGDTSLGGNDYDQVIAKKILKEVPFLSRPRLYGTEKERIRKAAEQAKRELTEAETAKIEIPSLLDGVNIRIRISREEFIKNSRSLTSKTISIVKKTLEEAELEPGEIGKVILVGGSTRMPDISFMLADLFKKTPLQCLNPDECVAAGAAIEADKLSGNYELSVLGKQDLLLLDIMPFSLSTNLTSTKEAMVIIKKNTTIPCKNTEYFSNDYHTYTNIGVYQGESKYYRENIKMGEINLSHPWSAPGTRDIAITFKVNANGIVEVTGHDVETGRELSAVLNFHSRMSQQQIETAREKVLALEFSGDKER